jgi:hypothetical protein
VEFELKLEERKKERKGKQVVVRFQKEKEME